MTDYAIIVQNDESAWNDIKGDMYHYPSKYRNILAKGCKVIYYTGRMKSKSYMTARMTPEPHYFGIGTIGDSIVDPDSHKKNYYCEILDYQEFEAPVPLKIDTGYLEEIPASHITNYWRDGVRKISKKVYDRILSHAKTRGYIITLPTDRHELESYDLLDGNRRVRYTSYYERNQFYRTKAIERDCSANCVNRH